MKSISFLLEASKKGLRLSSSVSVQVLYIRIKLEFGRFGHFLKTVYVEKAEIDPLSNYDNPISPQVDSKLLHIFWQFLSRLKSLRRQQLKSELPDDFSSRH